VRPGVTTAQLDKVAEDLIAQENAIPSFKGYRGYPFATCMSRNEGVVHGFPTNTPLLPGDILGIDVGVYQEGFHADAALTVAVGSVDAHVEKLMETTRRSLALAIAQVKPGNRFGDISAAIQREAESNGFNVVRDMFGHGVGRELHEEPLIPNFGVTHTGPKLKQGMVFALEPMLVLGNHPIEVLSDGWTVVTKDRKWSAHEEHTVVVTKDGVRILTG
jgi:methionyl aminopeptidase